MLSFALVCVSFPARAQEDARGFAVERFEPSPAGGGWLALDDLAMHRTLGGAIAVTTGYADSPLRIRTTDGSQHLAVVSRSAFVDVGFAVAWDRFRVTLDLPSPVLLAGESGVVGHWRFTAPSLDAGSAPDLIADPRIGFAARVLGDRDGSFRLGLGGRVYFPNGDRADYDTDGTFRAKLRAIVAGDVGSFAYSAEGGVHVRPLDDSPIPGSPRGSELLFGAGAGGRIRASDDGKTSFVVGPEVFGATALRSPATAVEALLGVRFEHTRSDATELRLKLGGGGGLDAHFGAPAWRVVLGVELSAHATER